MYFGTFSLARMYFIVDNRGPQHLRDCVIVRLSFGFFLVSLCLCVAVSARLERIRSWDL